MTIHQADDGHPERLPLGEETAGDVGRGIPRTGEALAALLGLALLLPLLAVVALLIRLTSPGPALFRQVRMGRFGIPFTLVKFRTMRVDNRGPLVTAKRDSRVTPIGRILRKTKLDELPELWNVARGDISLVGPRPEVPQYVDLANPRWRKTLAARPGITDPVTLILRNEEELLGGQPDPERFYLEVLQPYKLAGYLAYLDRRTPTSDWRVLTRTLSAIFFPAQAPPPSLERIQGLAGHGGDA